jgi:outer membrane scaffolding protein for murein synthesis (MipA/OmpV family)
MFDLSATAYGENIGDSPIVQDDITGRVGVGYAFRF